MPCEVDYFTAESVDDGPWMVWAFLLCALYCVVPLWCLKKWRDDSLSRRRPKAAATLAAQALAVERARPGAFHPLARDALERALPRWSRFSLFPKHGGGDVDIQLAFSPAADDGSSTLTVTSDTVLHEVHGSGDTTTNYQVRFTGELDVATGCLTLSKHWDKRGRRKKKKALPASCSNCRQYFVRAEGFVCQTCPGPFHLCPGCHKKSCTKSLDRHDARPGEHKFERIESEYVWEPAWSEVIRLFWVPRATRRFGGAFVGTTSSLWLLMPLSYVDEARMRSEVMEAAGALKLDSGAKALLDKSIVSTCIIDGLTTTPVALERAAEERRPLVGGSQQPNDDDDNGATPAGNDDADAQQWIDDEPPVDGRAARTRTLAYAVCVALYVTALTLLALAAHGVQSAMDGVIEQPQFDADTSRNLFIAAAVLAPLSAVCLARALEKGKADRNAAVTTVDSDKPTMNDSSLFSWLALAIVISLGVAGVLINQRWYAFPDRATCSADWVNGRCLCQIVRKLNGKACGMYTMSYRLASKEGGDDAANELCDQAWSSLRADLGAVLDKAVVALYLLALASGVLTVGLTRYMLAVLDLGTRARVPRPVGELMGTKTREVNEDDAATAGVDAADEEQGQHSMQQSPC